MLSTSHSVKKASQGYLSRKKKTTFTWRHSRKLSPFIEEITNGNTAASVSETIISKSR